MAIPTAADVTAPGVTAKLTCSSDQPHTSVTNSTPTSSVAHSPAPNSSETTLAAA
jgi:hypothetical protein